MLLMTFMLNKWEVRLYVMIPSLPIINFICNVDIIIYFGKIAYGSNHSKLRGPFNEQLNMNQEPWDFVELQM